MSGDGDCFFRVGTFRSRRKRLGDGGGGGGMWDMIIILVVFVLSLPPQTGRTITARLRGGNTTKKHKSQCAFARHNGRASDIVHFITLSLSFLET